MALLRSHRNHSKHECFRCADLTPIEEAHVENYRRNNNTQARQNDSIFVQRIDEYLRVEEPRAALAKTIKAFFDRNGIHAPDCPTKVHPLNACACGAVNVAV